TFHDVPAAAETLRAVAAHSHVIRAQLVARDGSVVATYSRTPWASAAKPAFDEEILKHPAPLAVFENDLVRVLEPVRLNHEIVGSIVLESDTGEIWSRLGSFGGIVILVMVSTFWLALVLSGVIARMVCAPIERLIDVTRAVGHEQRYDVRAVRTTD